VTLVRDKAGRPRARLKFLADITEKKLLEEKFLRVQRLEAIGTLSGGIAHDLNNILAPILMSAGLLRDKLTDARDRELLGLIESSARRGAEVIRQLLTFSRGIEGERASVQLRHLVKEMAGIARETFPRNLTWIDDIPKDLWPIVADPTQLHQVLMNLCVNARDAMPSGGTLTVTAKNVELEMHDTQFGANAVDGPYVLLTVRDTGQGISRAILDRIFDPFFTTKPIGSGTGLGLSTVLGIVRSHGGFVTVYSEPGHGSAFHVYLPATPDAVTMGTAPAADDLANGTGETILVVDDEASIVTAVQLCLERRGYRVLAAANGQAALNVLAANSADVEIVFTDVMMPVMDGLALAREVHRLYPDMPVIASSGLDLQGRPSEIEAGVISEFLTKPYQPPALLAAIRRQLKSGGPTRA
jgi:nitrogen-specific signal transduction histidine kinase/ActR/RegA family two-component response regulator